MCLCMYVHMCAGQVGRSYVGVWINLVSIISLLLPCESCQFSRLACFCPIQSLEKLLASFCLLDPNPPWSRNSRSQGIQGTASEFLQNCQSGNYAGSWVQSVDHFYCLAILNLSFHKSYLSLFITIHDFSQKNLCLFFLVYWSWIYFVSF